MKDFFGEDLDSDPFLEEDWINFKLKCKFKIVDNIDNCNYYLSINYLYKNELKKIDKEIVNKLNYIFPLNIKDIGNLNLDEYKLYKEYNGEFDVYYNQEFNIILSGLY